MFARKTYALSIILVVMMIGTAFSLVKDHKEAEAVTIAPIPFAGTLGSMMLCCNGLQFSLSGTYQTVARGTFIFPWQNMIPIPTIGWGLYSWWSLIPGETVLGSATPGGVCITIVSECEVSTSVNYSVNQMGTTLL